MTSRLALTWRPACAPQADVIDYEELLNGVRAEGTFSVYNTLVNKTVAIPGSAIPLGILSMLGFLYPVGGTDQV